MTQAMQDIGALRARCAQLTERAGHFCADARVVSAEFAEESILALLDENSTLRAELERARDEVAEHVGPSHDLMAWISGAEFPADRAPYSDCGVVLAADLRLHLAKYGLPSPSTPSADTQEVQL